MNEQNTVEYSIPYLLWQIAMIQTETTYLNEAINKLGAMSEGNSGSPGNIQGRAMAIVFSGIVRCRETTNQQILHPYEKIYDDLAGKANRVN